MTSSELKLLRKLQCLCQRVEDLESYGAGVNLYNANGTLTGNRHVSGDNYILWFDQVNSFKVDANSTILLNSTAAMSLNSGAGFSLDAVDYIDFQVDPGGYIEFNSDDIRLTQTLPENTNPDSILVTDGTGTGNIQYITLADLATLVGGGGGGSVTGANNGLNLSGTTVKLGGNLLANTSITGAFNFGWSGIAAFTGSSNSASITSTVGDISLVSAGNINLTFPTELVLNSTLATNASPTSFVTTSGTGTGNLSYSTVAQMQAALGIPTTGSFTTGSVLFAGATGNIDQDNSNLFWDNSSNRLGIKTTTPTVELDVVGYGRFTPGTSAVGSTAIIEMSQTWNNASQVFGIFMNITDTTSASSSNLIDTRISNTSKFTVRKDGLVTAANGITLSAGTTTYSSALTNLASPTTFLTMSGTSGTTQYSSISDVQTALGVTPVSLTAGYIAYGTGSGITGESGFFYDTTNNRLGLGTDTPTTKLHVIDTISTSPRGILSSQYSDTTDGARIGFAKARGTTGSPTVVVTGDTIGRLMFRGYDGTFAGFVETASIEVSATGTIGNALGRVPTQMIFSTGTDATQTVLTEAMRIAANQFVGIGTLATPNSKLEITTNSLGTTQTNTSGLLLSTTTSAAAGAQQISPATRWRGNGWKTNTGGASQPLDYRAYVLPVQGSSTIAGNWVLEYDINGTGTYTSALTHFTSGYFQINSNASNRIGTSADNSGFSGSGVSMLYMSHASTTNNLFSHAFISNNRTGTTGNIGLITATQNWTPSASSSANYRLLDLSYTVNATAGTASGVISGIYLNATETSIGSTAHNLIDLNVGGTSMFKVTNAGKPVLSATNTAAGTTTTQTINKPSGTVNIAASGTSVTVNNSLVSTSSIVFAVVRTNDTTADIKNVVPGSGSFVINMNAAVTAETSIGFFVIN